VREKLPGVVTHDKAGVQFLHSPRRREAAGWHLGYAKGAAHMRRQQSRRDTTTNGFAFVPLNLTVPPIPHTASAGLSNWLSLLGRLSSPT